MATLLVDGIPSPGKLFELQALLPGASLIASVSNAHLLSVWTASNPGRFHLQTAADLSGGTWADIDSSVILTTNGASSASVPLGSAMGFYRLKYQARVLQGIGSLCTAPVVPSLILAPSIVILILLLISGLPSNDPS